MTTFETADEIDEMLRDHGCLVFGACDLGAIKTSEYDDTGGTQGLATFFRVSSGKVAELSIVDGSTVTDPNDNDQAWIVRGIQDEADDGETLLKVEKQ